MVVKIEILKTEDCPFCPMATEIVNKIAKEFGDKVEVIEFLVDKDPEGEKRARFFGVKTVPSIIVNGMLKHVGVPREEILREEVKQALSEEK